MKNEVYKAEIKRFVEELEDSKSLAQIYGFAKVHYEYCNGRKAVQYASED